jgi:hypothetical protein
VRHHRKKAKRRGTAEPEAERQREAWAMALCYSGRSWRHWSAAQKVLAIANHQIRTSRGEIDQQRAACRLTAVWTLSIS